MKWTKIGLVFQPAQHRLPYGCSEFAQAPQALVLGDRVRIYFSTRQREKGGKFLSHIAFVDFDHDLKKILQVSDQPVLPLGARGCFDEHGIFPMNVLRHQDVVYGFTCGWSRRVSVSVETSIGLAISRDEGLTFDRAGDGPVMSSALHEPVLVGDPFVQVHGDKWHMWYIYGVRWNPATLSDSAPARVYKIAHATSPDGRDWTRTGKPIIDDRLNPDECQALPTVVQVDGRHHMYFCYREATDFRKNRARGYRLGYAYSDDLIKWVRDDQNVGITFSPGDWDSDMLCYPHLFRVGDTVYLLYNGNEFGKHGFGLARLDE
jgi:hypothetical protein